MRFPRYTSAVLAIAFLATACGSSDDAAAVTDFAEIQAGGITITPAADGRSAVLEVATSIDVVCAVAYGPTEDFGGLATDDDMAGGGHSDHGPVMRGLQPDTEYFYRLQGVGGDGRIFASGVMTFRTPPAAIADERPGTNLAVGATVVGVSSEFSDAFAADNAVDGDAATEWSSRGDGDDAFIVIDLGEEVNAAGVGFHTREMTDGSATTTSFTVTVDDSQQFGPFPAGPGLAIGLAEFTGRVVRFDVDTSTGGNTGAVEVEIYGR